MFSIFFPCECTMADANGCVFASLDWGVNCGNIVHFDQRLGPLFFYPPGVCSSLLDKISVYTLTLVLETQWPQPVIHVPKLPEPILLKQKLLLYIQIAVLNHIYFKTPHTILFIWHSLHKSSINLCQMPNFNFLLSTLTPHTIRALAVKGPQVSSSVLE